MRPTKSKPGDDVILVSENEIRILPVSGISEEGIHTGDLLLPRSDADVKYYPDGGRAFIYGWQGNYLAESEAIAELEKNVALKQMFSFAGSGKMVNVQFFVMAALLLITIFILHK